MIEGACINRSYSMGKNGPIVHWFIRTENGKFHVKDFTTKPFIFGKFLKKPTHPDILDIPPKVYTTQCGESVRKIIVKAPKSVTGYEHYDRKLAMRIEVPPVKKAKFLTKTFEDNIEFPDRVAVEHGIKYGMWTTSNSVVKKEMIGGTETEIMPHVMTLDIEVRTYQYDEDRRKEVKGAMPDIQDPSSTVLSIQCLDNQTEEIYLFRMSKDYWDRDRYEEIAKKAEKVRFGRKSNHIVRIPFKMTDDIKKLVDGKNEFIVHEHVFYSEKAMLNFWMNFIIKKDYDIICAFYGMNFDFPYLFARMKALKLHYNKLSPLNYCTVRLRGKTEKGYNKENDIRIPGRNLMDTRVLFMDKIYEKRQKNGLDDFSIDFLKIGKVKHDPVPGKLGKFHSIDYEFFRQPKKFREYACRDVILDYYLQKIMGIWRHYITLAKRSGCQIFQITKSRKRLRQTSLFYGKDMQMVIEPDSYGETFEGADVDRPTFIGKIEMGADLDLTSQYPSAIQAANISWDTLILDHTIFKHKQYSHVMSLEEAKKQNIPYCSIPLKGIYFRTDKEGLYTRIINDSRNLRDLLRIKLDLLMKIDIKLDEGKSVSDLIKVEREILQEINYHGDKNTISHFINQWDNDQKVLKIEINSIYGNLPPFLAACVTAVGRKSLMFTRNFIEKKGYPPVYSDTDSVIFRTKRNTVEGAVELCDWLVKGLNKSYVGLCKKYGWRNFLDIKSEEIYDPIIFVEKKTGKKGEAASKKYVKHLVADRGKVLAKPKVEAKGILKRRESSVFATDLGNLLIYYIGMNYSNSVVIDRTKKLINKFTNSLADLNVPEEEWNELKKKLFNGRYSLEEIAFPVNINKEWNEYKVDNYIRKGVRISNDYKHLWTDVPRKLGKGDTAFMVHIKQFRYEKDEDGNKVSELIGVVPYHQVWSLNDEGKLHPKFEVDYDAHIERAVKKYTPLLKAVGIKPNIFTMDKGQKTLW